MTTSKNLQLYIDFKNQTPAQLLALIIEVKATHGVVKSLRKLDTLCFELYKNNVSGK